MEVEFHCAVARKVRAGAIPRSAAAFIFSQFQRHIEESRFDVLAIAGTDYTMSREWIAQVATPLRALDALHLAVACSHGLALVTTDEVLAKAAKRFGITCRLLS